MLNTKKSENIKKDEKIETRLPEKMDIDEEWKRDYKKDRLEKVFEEIDGQNQEPLKTLNALLSHGIGLTIEELDDNDDCSSFFTTVCLSAKEAIDIFINRFNNKDFYGAAILFIELVENFIW